MADQPAVIVSDLLYDGLTEVDGRSEQLLPGLATSWEPNDTYSVWRFEIDRDRIDPAVVVDYFNSVAAGEYSAAASILLDEIDAVAVTSDGIGRRFSS